MIVICTATVQLTVPLSTIAGNNVLKNYYSVARREKEGIIIKRTHPMHMVHDQNLKETLSGPPSETNYI